MTFYLSRYTTVFRSRLIYRTFRGWIKPGIRLLDIGCGNGVVSEQLQQAFKIQLFGCDVYDYRVAKIRFKQLSNQNRLPYRNQSFEVALLCDCLHHMSYDNQVQILKEAKRVAKYILIFEDRATIAEYIFDYLLNKIHFAKMPILFTFRTDSQWRQLLKEIGTRVEFRDVDIPWFYPFRHIAIRVS